MAQFSGRDLRRACVPALAFIACTCKTGLCCAVPLFLVGQGELRGPGNLIVEFDPVNSRTQLPLSGAEDWVITGLQGSARVEPQA